MEIQILKIVDFHYLIESNPPNAGEPINTARVTMIPKPVITKPNLLFIKIKNLFYLKNNMIIFLKIMLQLLL